MSSVESKAASTFDSGDYNASIRRFEFARGIQLVGIPSSLCYAMPIDDRLQLQRERKSIGFSLEETLPLDAEQMSFWIGRHLIVATNGDTINACMQEAGVSCEHLIAVVPTAMFAVQELLSRYPSQGRVAMIIDAGASLDLVLVDQGELCQWRWVDRETAVAVVRHWSEEGESLKAIVVPVTTAGESISEHLGCEVQVEEVSVEEWIVQSTNRIGCGESAPLVNLTNGPLNKVNHLAPVAGTIRLAAITLMLALCAICISLSWRAAAYRTRAHELTVAQASHFKKLFPKQPIPTGILGRIESEYRRLSATKGSEGSQVPTTGSAVPVMAAFWRSLPADLPLEVEVLHFVPMQLRSISGVAKTFADLESLRQSLISQGFDVQPVSASQTARGVSLQWDTVSWQEKR